MKKVKGTDKEEDVLKRLNAIVYLLAELNSKGDIRSSREKIGLLNKAGLNYKEIAELLGKSPNYVSVELNTLRKKKNG